LLGGVKWEGFCRELGEKREKSEYRKGGTLKGELKTKVL